MFAQRSGQIRPAERSGRRPGQGEDNPNRKGAAGNFSIGRNREEINKYPKKDEAGSIACLIE